MAVVENGGISLIGSSNFGGAENEVVVAGDPHSHHHPSTTMAADESPIGIKSNKFSQPTDETFNIKFDKDDQELKIITSEQQNTGLLPTAASGSKTPSQNLNCASQQRNQSVEEEDTHQLNKGDDIRGQMNDVSEELKKEMKDLEEMLSKLNPMAKEFVPPAFVTHNHHWLPLEATGQFGHIANSYAVYDNVGNLNGYPTKKKKSSYNNGKQKLNGRTSFAQRADVIRRTVYVSDVDHQVTEEQLANLFLHCGQVVDCRVCGDPNSVLRFAFIEFTDEEGAINALSLSGTMLGFYPVMVQPSKTAIAPVNPTFLPQVVAADVKLFFESLCGQVQRLRLLGDYNHPTRIAFVEFERAESAIAALNCSGAILGSLPLRVSPSKTPVRSRLPR